MRKFLFLFYIISTILSWFVLAFTFGGFAGEIHFLLDKISHFRVTYFLLSVVFIILQKIFFSLSRIQDLNRIQNFKINLFVSGLGIFINFFLIIPYLEWKNPNLKPDFTILLSNVEMTNHDYNSHIEMIAESNADIIVLEEANEKWKKAMSYLEVLYPYHQLSARNDYKGISVYSRISLDNYKINIYSEFNNPILISEFEIKNTRITLVAVHSPAPRKLSWYTYQLKEFSQLSEFISGRENLILVGDLNTTMWSVNYKKLLTRSGLKDRFGLGIHPSYPSFPFPLIPIDHCLSKGKINLDYLKRGKITGSDHYPMLCGFNLE